MFENIGRKIFWLMVSSSIFFLGSAFSRSPQQLQNIMHEIKGIQSDGAAIKARQSVKPVLAAPPQESAPAPVKFEEVKSKIDNKEYVEINNKYYEYREDHIYMVNGVRTYFINNRAHEEFQKAATVASNSAAPENAAQPSMPEASDSSTDASILSPVEALKKVRAIQKQAEERDRYLNTINSSN